MLGEVLNEGFTKFLTAIDAKDVMGGGMNVGIRIN